ncbi:MAG TPA: hypothetical protein PLD20_02395 [Blastocatellia bacterium]|nr:hypothetical protein [Blastocatellia bacterium]HMV82696.1 hypothetical protein [Blastocatellia bacterium]HMX26116.1 hypothetical protein [Blastocatellia bacterium]HMY72707.1 hypothetical protein [Blastocatellia bacterium]HMZ16787.1 hypothetical protein [Blastocatellia bacterium]
MKKKVALALFLMLNLMVIGGFAQDKKSPVTQEEILTFLKTKSDKRIEQGDLAGEISQRGVAFPVTEEILETFRKAGARAFLLDAIRNSVKKEEPAPLPDRPRLKTLDETAQQQQATEESEEAKEKARAEAFAKLPFLEQARHYALEYQDNLPDFMATQIVTRYAQKPGDKDWKKDDTLEIELSYRERGGEKYKLTKIDGKASTLKYENLGGATSSGEFGSLLTAAFSPQSRAEFKELRKDIFNKRQTVVYDFKVKKAFSANQITDRTTHQSVIAGYQGTVWIDAETKRVLRIEQSSEGVPANFAITLSESAVEYDWVKIADQPYLLPVRAEVLLGSDRDRYYTRNVIEFKNYRKFDSDIKFLDSDK